MKGFIEVHKAARDIAVFINVKYIDSVVQNNTFTEIHSVNNTYLQIKGSYEEVVNKIKQAVE